MFRKPFRRHHSACDISGASRKMLMAVPSGSLKVGTVIDIGKEPAAGSCTAPFVRREERC
jgi:hypothetical protein